MTGCGSQKRITGSVVDKSGLPIEGVSVQVANSEFKSQTDSKGGYVLDYAPGELEIIFSKAGYATRRRNLNLAQKTSYPLDITHLLDDPNIISSMRQDLHNLIVAEEAYYADSQKYTSTLSNCATPAPSGSAYYCPTSGNVLGAVTLTADGWSATITNVHMTNPLVTCTVFIGHTATPPATKQGEPKCS